MENDYNVYIGARYIPIFAGAWKNNISYEPLVIVEYQGNSYTSKTYVPQGVSVTNTDYWALTGNYNAQVEQYRQEVENLREFVNEFNESININDLKVNLGNNLLTSGSGDNWTGNMASGFTYNGAGNDVLTLPVSTGANQNYLLSFQISGSPLAEQFTVQIGDTKPFLTYNGTNKFNFGIKTISGGNVIITPIDNMTGVTISNISLKSILPPTLPQYAVNNENGTLLFGVYAENNDLIIGSAINNYVGDGSNTILGKGNMPSLTSGFYNTVIGFRNGSAFTVGSRNEIIGVNNLNRMVGADRNIAIGTFVGSQLTGGSNNIMMGCDVQYVTQKDVSNNTVIGMFANPLGAGDGNTLIGAGVAGVCVGENNTLIGYSCGDQVKTGSENVLIGHYAGRYLSTGNNCVYIGSNTNAIMQSIDNQINIGNYIIGGLGLNNFMQIGNIQKIVRTAELVANYSGLAKVDPANPSMLETYSGHANNFGGLAFHGLENVTTFAAVSRFLQNRYITYIYGRNNATNQAEQVLAIDNGYLCIIPKEAPTSGLANGLINFDGTNLKIYVNGIWKTIMFEE